MISCSEPASRCMHCKPTWTKDVTMMTEKTKTPTGSKLASTVVSVQQLEGARADKRLGALTDGARQDSDAGPSGRMR